MADLEDQRQVKTERKQLMNRLNEKTWIKSLSLVNIEPKSIDYYDRFPFTPGISFIKAMIQ